MTKPSSHADGAPPPSDIPEPTLAEKAKTLTVQGGQSTLSTMSQKHEGYPFGSVMPYGLTADGEPTFLVSSMAMHTKNVLANPRATLLITQTSETGNPLGAGRISLMGDVEVVEDDAFAEEISKDYLARNPSAQHWVHFDDFRFFHLKVVDIYFVGGFGVMGWISADDYKSASPDPLRDVAAGVIQHMNDDHRDSLVLLAQKFAGLQAVDAEMMAVDRLGFNLRVQTADGMKGARIGYPQPVDSSEQIRGVFVNMVKNAREA